MQSKKFMMLSPIDQAKNYKDFGFNLFAHIVDLDGALNRRDLLILK